MRKRDVLEPLFVSFLCLQTWTMLTLPSFNCIYPLGFFFLYLLPSSLTSGGGIVGLATNWLALKWIFEPVNPVQIGPFILQGKFLRRQREVAAEFSNFFASKILTGEQIWLSILTDPETRPAFAALFAKHFHKLVGKVTRFLRSPLEPETMELVTRKALDKLPDHLPVIFPYMDKALGLQRTLCERMEQMTSQKFERVLHPIFEEDELTLILAGAVLGFAAGLIQQGLETGQIKVPNLMRPLRRALQRLVRAMPWRKKKDSNDGADDDDNKLMDDASIG
jgi:uncharacterized membrane protein YheB (UPF0754 family)